MIIINVVYAALLKDTQTLTNEQITVRETVIRNKHWTNKQIKMIIIII